jgi:cytosine/adenosine deaminase-related metal-dependent hydrolase
VPLTPREKAGSIAVGKRADLVLCEPAAMLPLAQR